MPKNKDLKRLTRARMRKTGEAYTAARSRLLEKREQVAPTAPDRDLAALAGMSDDAVLKATGRDWAGWVRALDAVEAAGLEHREIAEHVAGEHEISGWWAQTVAVGYERIRGLRDIGQRRSGSWDASKSKTVPVPIEALWRAFANEEQRRRWLPDVDWSVRTSTDEKSIRINWEDGTRVDFYFWVKGEAKSQVTLQHKSLASAEDAQRVKRYWSERLATLARLVTAGGS